jgi:hypothetical protein
MLHTATLSRRVTLSSSQPAVLPAAATLEIQPTKVQELSASVLEGQHGIRTEMLLGVRKSKVGMRIRKGRVVWVAFRFRQAVM